MKRAAVTVLGGVLLVAGAAMLVLPGPGMVVCAAGLAVLATEYQWARRSVGWAQERAREGLERTGSSLLLTIGSAGCGLILIVVGIVEIVNLPLLNTVTAAFVMAGGLFLTVSSCWARCRQRGHHRDEASERSAT